jgi:hypothetical protein
MIFRDNKRAIELSPMPVETEAPKKEYSPPVLATLTRAQATLFLVGHAWIGDPGARP